MSIHRAFAPRAGGPPLLWVGNVGASRLDLCHRQKVSLGARVLLSEVATAVFAFRAYQRGLRAAGACLGRSERQVGRWARELTEAGLIRQIRRGRKRTNIILLAKGFFTKLARICQRALPKGRPEPGLLARMDGCLRDAWRRRVGRPAPPGQS